MKSQWIYTTNVNDPQCKVEPRLTPKPSAMTSVMLKKSVSGICKKNLKLESLLKWKFICCSEQKRLVFQILLDLKHLYGLLDGKTAFVMKHLISWETQNVVWVREENRNVATVDLVCLQFCFSDWTTVCDPCSWSGLRAWPWVQLCFYASIKSRVVWTDQYK